jgi:hypothetical protein
MSIVLAYSRPITREVAPFNRICLQQQIQLDRQPRSTREEFCIIDVQIAAAHGLGHIKCLGCLNISSDWCKNNYNQIMNGYHDPQRNLDTGDANGLCQKYH